MLCGLLLVLIGVQRDPKDGKRNPLIALGVGITVIGFYFTFFFFRD